MITLYFYSSLHTITLWLGIVSTVTASLSTRSDFKQINLITNIWYIRYLWRHLGDNKLCRTPTPLKALIPSVVVHWPRLLNLNDSVDSDSLADVQLALYELSLTFSGYSCLSSLSFLQSCDRFWVVSPVHPCNITVSHWSARGSFQSEIAVAVRTAPSHYNENPILISSIKWLDQQFSATQALAILLLPLCFPPNMLPCTAYGHQYFQPYWEEVGGSRLVNTCSGGESCHLPSICKAC